MSRNVIKLVQGDSEPEIVITLRDETVDDFGNRVIKPIDLTELQYPRIYVRALGSLTLTDTITGVVYGLPTTGKVKYTLSTAAFPTAGEYEGEVKLIMVGGGVFTLFDTVRFRVRAKFN
jgi:hypothetical protein